MSKSLASEHESLGWLKPESWERMKEMKKFKSLLIATAVTAVAVVPVFANVSGLVSTSVSTSTSVSVSVSQEEYMLGDVNNDKSVDLADAKLTLEAALKIKQLPTPAAIKAADVDKNGSVELADAKAILEAALKIKPLAK